MKNKITVEEIGIGARTTVGHNHMSQTGIPDFESTDGDPHLATIRGEELPTDPPDNLDDIFRRYQE